MKTWLQKFKTWFHELEEDGSKGLLLLATAIALAMPLLFRASSLFFSVDDYRFLWWAYKRADAPWMAFFDPPLFETYYRPIVSLIWWLQYTLLGVEPFYYQMTLSLMWLGILVLLFFWGWRQRSVWAGGFIVLFFLGNHGGHQWIFWKSWYTSLSSVFFQLLALWILYSYLRRPGWGRAIALVIFILLAWLSKESAVFCLPITSTALILSMRDIPWKRRGLVLVSILIGTFLLFANHDTVRSLFQAHAGRDHGFADQVKLLGYYGEELWGHLWWILLGYILITLLHIQDDGIYAWRFVVSILVLGIALIFFYSYGLTAFEIAALSLTVYVYTLLFRSWNRILWLPLAWLTVAFWPLPKLGYGFIGYIGDSLLALSWVMGIALYQWILRSDKVTWNSMKSVSFISLIGFAILIILGINNAYHRSFRWLADVHDPTPKIVQRIIDDFRPIQHKGPLWIDPGIQLSYEVYLALIVKQKYPGLEVHLKPPPEGGTHYRLGAYTERVYWVAPYKEPLPLWLGEQAGNPPASAFDDPYWTPEHWNHFLISDCNEAEGFQPQSRFQKRDYPRGPTRKYINATLPFGDLERTVSYTTNSFNAPIGDRSDFVLHFWLLSHRWDVIDSVSVCLEMDDKIYEWAKIKPTWISSYHNWRRLSLPREESIIHPRLSTLDELKWSLTLHIREGNLGEIYTYDVSVDEITLATPQ